MMSHRGKRQPPSSSKLDDAVSNGSPNSFTTKRRKGRLAEVEEESQSPNPSMTPLYQPMSNGANSGSDRGGNDMKVASVHNRNTATENAAEQLFRKDLISAMKLPDSEPLSGSEYITISDQWKQDWERGVQVPVKPDSLPIPIVRLLSDKFHTRKNYQPIHAFYFKLPKNKFVRIMKNRHFNFSKHYLTDVAIEAEKCCCYDADDFDKIWLEIMNGDSMARGFIIVNIDKFERMMEEFESYAWVRTEERRRKLELSAENDDVVCDICRSPESMVENPIVFCDACNVAVHQACYGIHEVPPGPWMCRTCDMGINAECALCPAKTGGLKLSKEGDKWAHVSCAIWIPEVSIGCTDKMEPITKIPNIPQSRWSLVCFICQERVGACIKCSVNACKLSYHVTCGFKMKLPMKAFVDRNGSVNLKAYCDKHAWHMKQEVKKAKSSSSYVDGASTTSVMVANASHSATRSTSSGSSRRAANSSCSSEDEKADEDDDVKSDQFTDEFRAKRSSSVVSVQERQNEEEAMREIMKRYGVEPSLYRKVVAYWLMRRCSIQNAPLMCVTRVLDKRPSRQKNQEEIDQEKMRKFVQVRQDLEKVRNLCYMVMRRERFRRTYLRTREQTFAVQRGIFECGVADSLSTAHRISIQEANRGPSIYDRLYSCPSAPELSTDFETMLSRIGTTKDDPGKVSSKAKVSFDDIMNDLNEDLARRKKNAEAEVSNHQRKNNQDKWSKNTARRKDASGSEEDLGKGRHKRGYLTRSSDGLSSSSGDELRKKAKLKKSREDYRGKNSTTELIVPQRQAAIKANESLKCRDVAAVAKVEGKKPSHSFKEMKKKVKEKEPVRVEEKKKPVVEVMGEPGLSFVPQRKAAKKAIEHIKNGLVKGPGAECPVEFAKSKFCDGSNKSSFGVRSKPQQLKGGREASPPVTARITTKSQKPATNVGGKSSSRLSRSVSSSSTSSSRSSSSSSSCSSSSSGSSGSGSASSSSCSASRSSSRSSSSEREEPKVAQKSKKEVKVSPIPCPEEKQVVKKKSSPAEGKPVLLTVEEQKAIDSISSSAKLDREECLPDDNGKEWRSSNKQRSLFSPSPRSPISKEEEEKPQPPAPVMPDFFFEEVIKVDEEEEDGGRSTLNLIQKLREKISGTTTTPTTTNNNNIEKTPSEEEAKPLESFGEAENFVEDVKNFAEGLASNFSPLKEDIVDTNESFLPSEPLFNEGGFESTAQQQQEQRRLEVENDASNDMTFPAATKFNFNGRESDERWVPPSNADTYLSAQDDLDAETLATLMKEAASSSVVSDILMQNTFPNMLPPPPPYGDFPGGSMTTRDMLVESLKSFLQQPQYPKQMHQIPLYPSYHSMQTDFTSLQQSCMDMPSAGAAFTVSSQNMALTASIMSGDNAGNGVSSSGSSSLMSVSGSSSDLSLSAAASFNDQLQMGDGEMQQPLPMPSEVKLPLQDVKENVFKVEKEENITKVEKVESITKVEKVESISKVEKVESISKVEKEEKIPLKEEKISLKEENIPIKEETPVRAMVKEEPTLDEGMSKGRTPSRVPPWKQSPSSAKQAETSPRVVKNSGKKMQRGKQQRSNARGKGGRGRGSGKNQAFFYNREGNANTIGKLAGTVYDFDFEEDEFNEEGIENLKSLRDYKVKSVEAEQQPSPASSPKVEPGYEESEGKEDEEEESDQRDLEIRLEKERAKEERKRKRGEKKAAKARGRKAKVNSALYSPLREIRTNCVDDSGGTVEEFASVCPILPDLREAVERVDEKFFDPLSVANGDAIANEMAKEEEEEEDEEEEEEDLRKEVSVPQQNDDKESDAKMDSTADVSKEMEYCNHQLKFKIKGPFNFTPSASATCTEADRKTPIEPSLAISDRNPMMAQMGSASSSSNWRRMRKKELLRQYWTQDMNMDECGRELLNQSIGGSHQAIMHHSVNGSPSASSALITIPKATASMTSLPTREDYKGYNPMGESGHEKKKRKVGDAGDAEYAEKKPDVADAVSDQAPIAEMENVAPPPVKRRNRELKALGLPFDPPTPKLKIKIGGESMLPEIVEEKNLRLRPPKKRPCKPNQSSVPSMEELKEKYMMYRNEVMSQYEMKESEEAGKRRHKGGNGGSESKKRKKKSHADAGGEGVKRRKRGVSPVALEEEAHVQVISKSKTKLIIKFGQNVGNKVVAPKTADGRGGREEGGCATNGKYYSNVDDKDSNGAKVADTAECVKIHPIRLKLSRYKEGYVSSKTGGTSKVEGYSPPHRDENDSQNVTPNDEDRNLLPGSSSGHMVTVGPQSNP